MNKKIKKKLCWNCEGESNFQAESCSYCGVSLTPLSIGNDQENSLSPPYRLVHETEDDHVPISPYISQNHSNEAAQPAQNTPLNQNESGQDALSNANDDILSNELKNDLKNTLLTVCLLFSGSVLFIFGLMILLFSENGQFVLKWSDQYWYLYFVIAIPMLLLGWAFLKKIEN